MSIDIHEEPWLREALGSLLVDEPTMSPAAVVDDVRRGETVRITVRRRRTAALAVAAVLALVAVPAGFVLRAEPQAATPPASSTSATPGSTAEVLRQRAARALATRGWTVVAQREPAINDGTVGTELDLDVARTAEVASAGTDGVKTTSVQILSYHSSTGPGHYLAQCTASSCPSSALVLPSTTNCQGLLKCYTDEGAYLDSVDLTWYGSLVLDRRYESGVLIEVLIGRDPSFPAPAKSVGPISFLTPAEARSLLESLGNPYTDTPVPSQSPRPIPSPTSDGFVPDADWESGVLAAFSGGITTVFQHADLTAATLSVSGREAEGDGGTFVLVSVDQGSTAAAQLASPPCGIDDPTCRVLLPWGKVTTLQGPAWISVVDVSYTDPVHRTRVASVVRGDTTVMVGSDSREVSTDFTYGASTAPGLSPDIIVERALAIPVPESMRAAVGKPMSTPPDAAVPSGSASASSDVVRPASAPACTRQQVSVAQAFVDGVTQERAIGVNVTIVGSKPCSLVGQPNVAAEKAGTPLALRYVIGDFPGWPAQPADNTPPGVLLPGEQASFIVAKTACDVRDAVLATTLRIRFAGQSADVVLPLRTASLAQCSADSVTSSSTVYVSELGKGGFAY
jgi:hypothetical protein